jgi:hypothetical protein
LTIAETEKNLLQAGEELFQYCSQLSAANFFRQPGEKWSVAQQVKHLIISAKNTGLAFTLPKFIIRIAGGKPGRTSVTYDELVARYKLILQQGGKAGARYSPAPVPVAMGKEKLLTQFADVNRKIIKGFVKNWKENQPDLYFVPHPLLGKITIRELGYFTIYHIYHHLESIQKISF